MHEKCRFSEVCYTSCTLFAFPAEVQSERVMILQRQHCVQDVKHINLTVVLSLVFDIVRDHITGKPNSICVTYLVQPTIYHAQ